MARNKMNYLYRRGILALIPEEEKTLLSDKTRQNLSNYDSICVKDFHEPTNDKNRYSARAVFFMLSGMNDEFVKSFFLGWLSASLPDDFSREALPVNMWRACLRVILVHWAAPGGCPYVGFDTVVLYTGLSKSSVWDARDYLIKAKILRRSGWSGHYYLTTQHKRTLVKLFIETERRFHSLTAEQLILKRDKAGPDWEDL